jgi:hypothetical protein
VEIQSLNNGLNQQATALGGDLAQEQTAQRSATDRPLEPDLGLDQSDAVDESTSDLEPISAGTYSRNAMSVSSPFRASGTISLIA